MSDSQQVEMLQHSRQGAKRKAGEAWKIFLQDLTKQRNWRQWGLSKKGWEVLLWKAATPLPSLGARNLLICWVCGWAALPPQQRACASCAHRGHKGQLKQLPNSLPHYLWSCKAAGVAVLLLEQPASCQNGTLLGPVAHRERPLNKGISRTL